MPEVTILSTVHVLAAAALLAGLAGAVIALALRGRAPRAELVGLVARVESLGAAQERSERALREELARGRLEQGQAAHTLRESVEKRLDAIHSDNAARLEQMRATVDEKLHATLEHRLGESFRQVAEHLTQVQQGLGEMRSLATGVGDLKKVLTNVKQRGGWGEVQLAALLEQTLAPTQYAANVATRPGSGERVEFAVRLPGRDGASGEPVWLPIDAKFPLEDYQRLQEALETGDRDGAAAAARDLERRVRGCARDVQARYLEPPHTTDFAILYLPVEGLHAEVLRRPGLVDALQREHRITLAGPTTLLAMLNSLQMGFRTLAIEKRSSEVWTLLSAVKGELDKFGGLLDGVQKKLHEASHKMDDARRKTRTLRRHLRGVEDSPEGALPVLGDEAAPGEGEPAGLL